MGWLGGADGPASAVATPLVAAALAKTTPLVATASWGYFRLRRTSYQERELEEWIQRIKGQPWQEAFVFLKHDDEGRTGPDAASILREKV